MATIVVTGDTRVTFVPPDDHHCPTCCDRCAEADDLRRLLALMAWMRQQDRQRSRLSSMHASYRHRQIARRRR